jgi:uncharacterized protein YfdQ (DUF2303 family)
MSENVIETFLQNGGAALHKLDTDTPAIVIGEKQKVHSLEGLLEAPVRIKENRKFDDLRGFVQYAKDYKGDGTSAFASRDRIQVVFDYHLADKPQWGAHVIEYAYRRSQRWRLWDANNNVWKSQDDFADFLDSGLDEITDPSQSAVLDLVKNFRATVNAEADSSIGADGTHFSYRQTVKGGSKKTDITVPEFLTVQVSPFDGLHSLNALIGDETKRIPTYKFRAKLSWRMKQNGDASKPDFKVQLLNFDIAIDETLESVRLAIKELTGIQTYIGG